MSASEPEADESLAVIPRPTSTLLVVFVHGFKGTDETFLQFPQRLQHILSETLRGQYTVECIVFPAYETKGNLNEAVIRFSDWLTTLTVEREVASGGGAGSAKIALCGHSMGGLLIADTTLEFIRSRPPSTSSPPAPIWPNIVACIAFDTPYLGLHPYIFKNSVTKAAGYADQARKLAGLFGNSSSSSNSSQTPLAALPAPPETPSGGWNKWTAAYAIGGTLLAAGAAAGGYYKRQDLSLGYNWATDHMRYVGTLWDEDALQRRLDAMVDTEEKEGVVFRILYTKLPPTPPMHVTSRTFVVLPTSKNRCHSRFLPALNNVAPDELEAHTGMFASKTNDGYYQLGLETAKFIRLAVRVDEDPDRSDSPEKQADDEGKIEREQESGNEASPTKS